MTRAKWFAVSAVALLVGGVSSAAIGWAFLARSSDDGKTALSLEVDRALRESRLDNARSNQPGEPASNEQEALEIDVSARTIPVTSTFKGSEIIVFGTVRGSRQEFAESGHYDVAVVVEGAMTPVVVRKKSQVAGIWLNTGLLRFASLPAYYAVASTRPLREIADSNLLESMQIGFGGIPLKVAGGDTKGLGEGELSDYGKALIRLKSKDGLYQQQENGVAFIGRSLFRGTIQLPANVPVGTVKAHVYLFHGGALLSSARTDVILKREGLELWMHNFAFKYPFFYGVFAVVLAILAGLIASRAFQRKV